MSEYAYGFDDLRGDIRGVLQSMSAAHSAQQKLDEALAADIQRVWADNAELRDELHALANRVEALTRAWLVEPAEVAEKIVRYPDGTMDCPMCHGFGALDVVQGNEITQVQCERCEGFGRVRDVELRIMGRRQ